MDSCCPSISVQFGARVQLVVQMIEPTDPLNPGVVTPIDLVGATNLSITLGYPDKNTAATFAATLFTDGSDGKITYTTSIDVDLSQVGTFAIQGQALLSGNLLPPTEVGYFDVKPNITGSASPPVVVSPSALIIFDPSNIRWAVTVSPMGVIGPPVVQSSGPATFLQFNSLVMKDQSGIYWTISINTMGVLSGSPAGSFPYALDYFMLTDLNGKSWIITVNESGNLVAS